MGAPLVATIEQLCVNTIRGLSIDAVQRANSGHPGLPLGAAPVAFVLWTRHLRHNPSNPKWANRDRFVLSAGHGYMLLYSLLFLTGYELTLDDLKGFRQWGSKTPGHPENILTPGVEMATGPLGQGFASAVGMAIAERYLSSNINRPGFEIVDHHTYVLCSDGDLMEGVTQEAASLAGHLKLGKLVVLYDDNHITIDGATDLSFSDHTRERFQALGWHVQEADGEDMESVDRAIAIAKKATAEPSLIICRTTIGFGSPNFAGKSKSHGAALGVEEVKLTKRALGMPEQEFYVPEQALDFFRQAEVTGQELEDNWSRLVEAFRATHPESTAWLDPDGSIETSHFPEFNDPVATRVASAKTLNAIAKQVPTLIGGAADLAESVGTMIEDSPYFQPNTPTGRNIAFGVREHAMMAAVNGITLHAGCRAFGGTFLIFSDYCRPALRLAALMEIPSIFLFSHDSIGLGEDGPTHQPIEHLMALRAIPNLNVMRPADAYETAACWKIAMEARKNPCALILTRQALPLLTPAEIEVHQATRGAYVLAEASVSSRYPEERSISAGIADLVIVATGSEVSVAMAAGSLLEKEGIAARVVSMPSWFLFERQPKDYRESIFPKNIPVVSVEAGATLGWARYAQAHVGIDHFGASAPGPAVMREFGFTPENVATVSRELLKR